MSVLDSTKINTTITFTSFYIAGIVAYFMHIVPFVGFILLILACFLLFKKLVSAKAAILFYLMFALALVNCTLQVKSYDSLSKFLPSKAKITGTVLSIPTTNNNGKTKFYLKAQSGIFDGEKAQNLDAKTIVTIYDTPENISKIKIADKIELYGKLRNPIKASNPSQFDYANYLKNHGIFSTYYVNSGSWKIVSEPQSIGGKFLQKLNDTRLRILEHQKKYIKSPNIEVLGGIVFGDDAINPPVHIKNSFINSGLLHILAASGMNVSIIFGIWFFIASRLRLNYRFILFSGAILVAFYTLMTGMGPSVLRAALMIEFVLLGKMIDRDTDSISLVFFVAFLMLLYNPAMINDVGFQLSFVVTFALMYYCPPVLEPIKNKFLEFIAGAVLIPFVAQLFASPIQMFYFNTYATYSVLANFVITPFVMIISCLGFAGSILAMLPFEGFVDLICRSFSFILNPVVTCLINISHYFAGLPHSLLSTFHPSYLQIVLYYTLLILFGFLLRQKFANKKLLTSVLVLFVFLCMSFIKIPSKDCEILVFDVGNADSFLIKTPKNKYIIIDTAHGLYEGSKATFSQADSIINKYLKDNGIKTIDLMILTHFDSDHSGGAVDIMKSVTVKKVVLNKDKDDSKTTKAIMSYLKQNNIQTKDAVNKDILYKEQNFSITAYTPDFTKEKNDNDNSTIALLSFKDFDMLFMGDGSVRSFNKIKKDLPKNDIEILKSGHHGARNTVTSKMLKTINTDAAIISTGLNNYGHPARETLNVLYENNIKIYRTDVNNAIKIISDGQNYKIFNFDSNKKRFRLVVSEPCQKLQNFDIQPHKSNH